MNFLKMLMNSFNLEESSLPLISVAADVCGVERFGVAGLEEGCDGSGVVVSDRFPDIAPAVAVTMQQLGNFRVCCRGDQ